MPLTVTGIPSPKDAAFGGGTAGHRANVLSYLADTLNRKAQANALGRPVVQASGL